MKGLIRIDVLISLLVICAMFIGLYLLLPAIIETAYRGSDLVLRAMQ